MSARCEFCNVRRSRLHRCVTCAKRGCGCCLFKSRAGRVCPGACHVTALKNGSAPRPHPQTPDGSETP
jgi:hypothetical protein